MIDPALASDAMATVMGDRNRTHGDALATLARIAGMWGAYLDKDLGASDVAAMMVMLKVARSRHAYDRDHYLDAIGYLMLAEDAARP